MRLTKRKAVEITKERWEAVVKKPLMNGWEWEGWQRYGGMIADCPCCEYAERHTGDCDSCPLLGMWTKEPDSECLDDDSPYKKWEEARRIHDKPGAKAAALEMVAICDRWLEEHKRQPKAPKALEVEG